MTQVNCRGCFELGSACARCPKCWEAMRRPWVKVPRSVAECPECGGQLCAVVNAWADETGQPVDLQIECENDELESENETGHRWWQSDWQPVVDAVREWCGAAYL